jgi:effector-binding domain-containing protein
MKYLYLVPFLFLLSCASEVADKSIEKQEATQDTSETGALASYELKAPDKLTDEKGIIGVFEVPEMLTMSVMDSVPLSRIAMKMSSAYATIQKDAGAVKAEINGAPGVIYYNNDTGNFVIECVLPIAEIPKKQPQQSKIVMLEPSRMLIYNYYGAYTGLNAAYEELIAFTRKNKMKQTGPMREFYITDPMKVKDTSLWFTRIMLPVK